MGIQKMRRDKGWSQEELALHSGLSVRTLQRIEKGRPASLESLKCLAAVFETSVSVLSQEQLMNATTITNEDRSNSQRQSFDNHAEEMAIEYVQHIKVFHLNWMAFAISMPFLIGLNVYLTPHYYWVIIVALGWGLGIALHAMILFGLGSVFSGGWEQREFQKRLNNIDR